MPAPTAPSANSPRAASASARPASARLDLHHARLAEPAVVALGDDRDDHVLHADRRVGGHRGGHGAVEHAPDGHRGGEVDRRLEHAPLGHLQRPGHLARAVEHGDARGQRLGVQRRGRGRHDRGHARARDAAPVGRLGLVAHHGDVADADARDVGDRARGPGLELADPQAERAQAAGGVHAADPKRRHGPASGRAGVGGPDSRTRLVCGRPHAGVAAFGTRSTNTLAPHGPRDARGLERSPSTARPGRRGLGRRAHRPGPSCPRAPRRSAPRSPARARASWTPRRSPRTRCSPCTTAR